MLFENVTTAKTKFFEVVLNKQLYEFNYFENHQNS